MKSFWLQLEFESIYLMYQISYAQAVNMIHEYWSNKLKIPVREMHLFRPDCGGLLVLMLPPIPKRGSNFGPKIMNKKLPKSKRKIADETFLSGNCTVFGGYPSDLEKLLFWNSYQPFITILFSIDDRSFDSWWVVIVDRIEVSIYFYSELPFRKKENDSHLLRIEISTLESWTLDQVRNVH